VWRIFSLLKGRLLGADLVEMSPLRDPMGVCAQLGGAVVRELLSVLGTFS
jgi:arginase family enzyme